MDTDKLAGLLAKKFIQRRDAKAIQTANIYKPVVKTDAEGNDIKGDNIPWTMGDLRAHIKGERTYGHYVSDLESNVKLFAFDIDLTKEGTWLEYPDLSKLPMDAFTGPNAEAEWAAATIAHATHPREDWKDRRHPGRTWYKLQMRTLAETLAKAVTDELGIQVAIAYSGNKGLHVYGFTGEMQASKARSGALLALEAAGNTFASDGEFVTSRGNNFYKYNSDDPERGWPCLEIEVYPKQEAMEGKAYGNLLRLPMGINQKNPKDPTFFIDRRVALDTIAPHPDPVGLLEGKSQWL